MRDLDIRERLGLRVRAIREARGVSGSELAYAVGISRSYLTSIERGRSSAGIVTIEKLADGLGVTVEELFRDEAFRRPGPHENAIIYHDELAADVSAMNLLGVPDPENEVVGALGRDSGATIATIAEATGYHPSKVHRILRRLVGSGDVRRVGPKRGGRWELVDQTPPEVA